MSFYNGYLTNIDIAANPFNGGYYGQSFLPFGGSYYGGFGSLSMLGRLGLFGILQNSMRGYSLQNYIFNNSFNNYYSPVQYGGINYAFGANTTPYGIESYGSNYIQNNYSYQYGAIGGIGDSFISSSYVNAAPSLSYLDSSYANTNFSDNSLSNSYVKKVDMSQYSGATRAADSSSYVTNVQYGTKDLNFWKSLGYNPENAQKMVNNVKTEKRGKNVSGQCGQVVRHAINSTYYGGVEHYKQFHRACNTGDEVLSKDGNFRKYVPNGTISAADIPPGAIIIYRGDTGNGQKGYVKGDPRGHIAVATGDGVHDESNRYARIRTDCIKEIWLPA